MQVICCVCHKTKKAKGWTQQAARSGVPFSHGYCPQCYRQLLERIENFFVTAGWRKSA